MNDNAIRALSDAIIEEGYIRNTEYVIAIRNISEGYNVDFTYTTDGEWSDEVYEQSCKIMKKCASRNKGDKYIAILAKSYKNGAIDLIRESHLDIKSKQ